jgi:hypothetical protein
MRYFVMTLALFIGVKTLAQEKLRTENVVIITLDGFRWQELFTGADSALISEKKYADDVVGLRSLFWRETPDERRNVLMPFFWNTIGKHGQLYGNRKYSNNVNCSNQMWFSYPGYNEILCGFADDARIKSNSKVDNPNKTVLEIINKQDRFHGKVSAFGSWDVFPFIIHEERSGVPVNAGAEAATGNRLSPREVFLNELQMQTPVLFSGMRLDLFTHHYALESMKQTHPRLVFISYGETDDFAHFGRYDLYLKSAQVTDKFIADVWQFLQNDPQYKNKTTMIITTDHGRGTVPLDTWRSHGIEIGGADQIWFAVIGPDTAPEGERKNKEQYFQNQVAGTAAAFLGVEYKNDRETGAVIRSMMKSK